MHIAVALLVSFAFADPQFLKIGRETEVYSRITGYYRPVKNWNDGKTQEFKERKVYALSHSRMIAGTPEAEKEEENQKKILAAVAASGKSAEEVIALLEMSGNKEFPAE